MDAKKLTSGTATTSAQRNSDDRSEHEFIAYHGDIVFTASPEHFDVLEDGYVLVHQGVVMAVAGSIEALPGTARPIRVVDRSGSLIIPSFNDLHIHAPQYPLAGLGYDDELLPWLERYTFPTEARYADPNVADVWYRRFITTLWKVGTLRFSAFATLHASSTLHLMKLCQESGLKPMVGKVNMDRNAPQYLTESTQQSLSSTEELINQTRSICPDVRFIVTPRFVPSTTPELMEGLGALAREYGLPVQSHLDENRGEVAWVHELHPDLPSYAAVYEHFGLMPTGHTIMAHCIWLTDAERQILKAHDVWLAHCPQSNLNLTSGIMPVRRNLDFGLKISIASDISAGNDPSMNRQIVTAIEASKAKTFEASHENDAPLTLAQAFHMATKAGGTFFGNVGSFEPGYEFDALVIRGGESPLDLSPVERLERFIYTGDDRDIAERYVSGQLIRQPFAN